MNILFIYNNLSEINNIEQALNSGGHSIYTARNYNEASEVLLRVKIDLIICELISDRIDGIQILRRIKNSDNLANIPFVLVSSALKDEEDLSFFRKLGAISIIEKPLTYKSIQTIIEKYLTSQELSFDSRQKVLSDEEFVEEYSNILTRRIQKRVRELEADQLFIHNLINSIPSAIFLVSQDFRITDINEAGLKYLGIKEKEEIKNRFCYNLIYKSNKVCNFEGHRCPILGVIQEKNSTEHYFVTENSGIRRHLNIHFAPVLNPQNNTILMLEHITDNTGTIEIINKSKENEFKLETILNESRYGIILIEKNQIININSAAKGLLGIQHNNLDELIKIVESSFYKDMTDAINQNVIFRREIYLGRGENEKVLIFEAQKISSAGRDFILIIIYDYTENSRLIQNLKDSEHLQRMILENIQDIFILLRNNTVVEISRQIENISGKKRETLIKQNIFSALPFIHESHLVDTGAKEITVSCEDGKKKFFLLKIFSITIRGERHILLQLSDITEKKEKEMTENAQKERINYIDRLDTVAKINRGIVQNINNFLAGINNFAEFLTKSDTDAEKIRLTANIIKKLTKNAAGALSKISNLLSAGSEEFRPLDIQMVLDELMDIIKYSLPKNIEIKSERLSSHNFVIGDYNALLQSFLNIIMNSIEAMEDGGRITINTENVTDAGPENQTEQKIRISISDTGRGIPEDIRNNIFTPYFSSKNTPGTGLGLSVVYNTVIRHKGSVSFKSEPNRGTTFTITLPVADATPETPDGKDNGNMEKILILSENSLERDIIKRILIRHNYDAYTAVDSYDALESLKVTKPSLIIMESGLSRISDEETFEKITDIYPDADIILYTGLIFDEKTINLFLRGIKSVIYKPLDIRELLTTVRNAVRKQDEKAAADSESVTGTIKKILIIDDEEYILSALKMNLSDRYEITIETSGTKALDRLLGGELFDSYIIDINMPDLNGLEFYKMLREVDPGTGKKVIFITGGISDEKIISEMNELKNEVFLLEKPFDIDELIKILS